MQENSLSIKERFALVTDIFVHSSPQARSELIYDTPFQLLVAVILSAQCTDKRVNIVTKELFKKVREAQDMSLMNYEELFGFIKSINYHNTKTKNLLATARIICDTYMGQVPNSYEGLTSLPGVGRKTANVLLAELFKEDVLAVDTHVFRVANRIGLTSNATTPLQVEQQLTNNIKAGLKATFHHWLILHGRYVCKAKKPLCDECHLKKICLNYEHNSKPNI